MVLNRASMKLLFIASDPREFGGLLAHCTGVRKLHLPVDWARTASLGDYQIVTIANGVGAARGAAAVDAAVAAFAADAMISVGFCGALDPQLQYFDIVVGDAVVAGDRQFAAAQPQTKGAHRPGAVATLDHIAATVAEKDQLHAAGLIAVEMEAAGVASRAQALGRPFFCIKTVTDLAHETLANDFNGALRSDGHFDTMRILASSLQKPWARLPELFRLQRRSGMAARSLGDFIANCRF